MSLFADIYLSQDSDAVKYDTEPEKFTDRTECTGFSPLELSVLWSIMGGVEWDVAMMDEFPCLLQVDGGERFIHRLPAAMVSELAALSPDQVDSATSAWAATEEMACDPEDIRSVVDELVRLSQRAGATSQSVYLWNCV